MAPRSFTPTATEFYRYSRRCRISVDHYGIFTKEKTSRIVFNSSDAVARPLRHHPEYTCVNSISVTSLLSSKASTTFRLTRCICGPRSRNKSQRKRAVFVYVSVQASRPVPAQSRGLVHRIQPEIRPIHKGFNAPPSLFLSGVERLSAKLHLTCPLQLSQRRVPCTV